MDLLKPYSPSMKALDVADVVALEQRIAAEGTSLLELMSRAGAALAQATLNMNAGSVVVLAGRGNNGGDGWVAAMRLAEAGVHVTLITRDAADAIKAEPARTAALGAKGFGVLVLPTIEEVKDLLCGADLILDCLLGTGFAHNNVREPFASWIEAANACNAPVLSADVPSGVNAQNGEEAQPCIHAAATVTMLAPKTGLVSNGVHKRCGTLFVAPLGYETLPDMAQ